MTPRSFAQVMPLVAVLLILPGCKRHHTDPVWPCGSDWRPVEYPQRNYDRITITQGVSGDVWFWAGNFMPMCPTGTVRPVVREVRVYELVSPDQIEWTTRDGHMFIRSVRSALVATTLSDPQGFFQLGLPVGRYSIFAVEDSLIDAGGFEADILPGQAVDRVLDITYLKAS
jgi:hypothetical protein